MLFRSGVCRSKIRFVFLHLFESFSFLPIFLLSFEDLDVDWVHGDIVIVFKFGIPNIVYLFVVQFKLLVGYVVQKVCDW